MFKLRYYQEEGIKAAFDSMRLGNHPLAAYPTGSGKTAVLAGITEKAINKFNGKVLILSHVKEILEQNYEALKFHLGGDVGLYSAGLGKRTKADITVAGIQSIYKRGREFNQYDLVIIDECHMIPNSGSGMYRKLFKVMGKTKYMGLTATPYRLGDGYIYGEGRLFTDLCIDYTTGEKFAKLVDEGWISDIKAIRTQLEFDTQKIHTRGGDFIETELSSEFDRDSTTNAAVKEMIRVGENYKKWLVFAIDINHAEHIAEELIRCGIPANVVHSKMEQNRDVVIRDYKSGKYRCLVNVGILTTGFDDPSIDLIGLLRPTQSPVLHVQTIGRGMRKSDGKNHCAVLDFAGNTKRLGPVNSITVKEKGKGVGGEPITKTCPTCDAIHHPSVRICKWCNYKFQFKHGLSGSDGGAVIARKTNWKQVDQVSYEVHKKPYRPDSLKVLYHCGLDVYSDYVFLDSRGYAKFKANHWVNFRGGKADSVDEALGESDIYKIPNRILVDTSAKYPIISDYSF